MWQCCNSLPWWLFLVLSSIKSANFSPAASGNRTPYLDGAARLFGAFIRLDINCSEIPPYVYLAFRMLALAFKLCNVNRNNSWRTIAHYPVWLSKQHVDRQLCVLHVPLCYIDIDLHVRRAIIFCCMSREIASRHGRIVPNRIPWARMLGINSPGTPTCIGCWIWVQSLETGNSSSRLSIPAAALLVYVVRLTHG
jgi:hypothetical protein